MVKIGKYELNKHLVLNAVGWILSVSIVLILAIGFNTLTSELNSLHTQITQLQDSQTYILLELKENEQSVNAVQTTVRKHTADIDKLINKYSHKYGVDPKLAHAVALVESGKNQNARNGNAVGVMQIKPSTAKGMGVQNVYSTEGNIEAGVKYLAYLKTKFNGDERKVISAYNAGPNAGQQFGNIPNKAYVKKVETVKKELTNK